MSDKKSKDSIETITIISIVLNNFSLAHIQKQRYRNLSRNTEIVESSTLKK